MASPGWGRHKIREKKFRGDTKLGKRNLDVSPGVYAKILCDAIKSIKFEDFFKICFNKILCPTMSSNSENYVILMGPFFFNMFD